MNFDLNHFVYPFVGGSLIGLAAILMMFLNGRIMGVSGIIGGFFNPLTKKDLWRYLFFLGLILGGFLIKIIFPGSLENTLHQRFFQLVLAGALVGFGTRLGSGCTSGHGICGVSRFSLRSIVATLTFMFFGFVTVYLMRFWGFYE